MNTLNNKFLYFLVTAPSLIILPFFFGFPSYNGEKFFKIVNGKPNSVSETYFILSQISIAICFIGILLFVISLIKLQKSFGVKPRIIVILIDPMFIRELFATIKQNIAVKIILLLDVILYLVIFFR